MTIQRVHGPDWGLGDKLTSAHMNAFEDRITSALDKRAGQTDTLASDVEVTGETTFTGDAHFDGATEINGELTVDGDETHTGEATFENDVTHHATVTVTGPAGKVETASGGRVVLGDNDYPQLKTGHTGRTVVRRIPASLVTYQSSALSPDGSMSSIDIVEPDSGGHLSRTARYARFGTVDTGSSTQSKAIVYNLLPYLIDGATVTEVTVEFAGASGHAALPARMPRIRVGRDDYGVDAALHSSGATVIDASTTTVNYQSAHGITATCDQNNVVDKNNGFFYLAILNEGGTNALSGLFVRNIWITQTIADLRPA